MINEIKEIKEMCFRHLDKDQSIRYNGYLSDDMEYIDSGAHRYVYKFKDYDYVAKFNIGNIDYNTVEKDTYDYLMNLGMEEFLLPLKYHFKIGNEVVNIFPYANIKDENEFSLYERHRYRLMNVLTNDLWYCNCGFFNDVLVIIDFSCPRGYISKNEIDKLNDKKSESVYSELYERDKNKLNELAICI